MFRVVIIEDEHHARKELEKKIQNLGDYQIIESFGSIEEARTFINESSFDLLCLDIGLPGLSGVDFLKEYSHYTFYTIFITGESAYAVEAFELGAVDYIRKPVNRERLMEALNKFETFRKGDDSSDIKPQLSEHFSLTPKEAEICEYIKDGYVKEEICQILNIGKGTLKVHLNRIYEKILYKGEVGTLRIGRSDSYARLLYTLYNIS